MAESGNPRLAEDVAAALAWWREAGVDACFADEPVNWLAERDAGPLYREGGATDRRQVQRQDDPGPRPRGGTGAARGEADEAGKPLLSADELPRDLSAFADWWLTEPKLDDGRTSGRVPPRGEAGAEVMILVAEPERDDRERLLSGPQGRLLDAMLGAMGLAPERVYLASALPRHMPMADWPALARSHGEILRRHVALVGPRRLIAFGSNVLPLLGNDPPNLGQFFTQFNHDGLQVPLWMTADLGVLLTRPRAKAKVWQRWLELDWASD